MKDLTPLLARTPLEGGEGPDSGVWTWRYSTMTAGALHGVEGALALMPRMA